MLLLIVIHFQLDVRWIECVTAASTTHKSTRDFIALLLWDLREKKTACDVCNTKYFDTFTHMTGNDDDYEVD